MFTKKIIYGLMMFCFAATSVEATYINTSDEMFPVPQLVYDNSNTNGIRTFSSSVSDAVVLAGTQRQLTGLSFYVITNGLKEVSDDDFQIQLYNFNTNNNTRGNLIWTSGWKVNVFLRGTAQEIHFTIPLITVNDALVWQVDHTDRRGDVGFLWGNPPLIGSCPNYGGSYHGTPCNYMAKIYAIPEPATLLLLGLGGLMLRRKC